MNGNLRREARQTDKGAAMTRKDYILLASAFTSAYNSNNARDAIAKIGIDEAVYWVTDALRADNPRFDREHFLAVVRGEKDLNSRPARPQKALYCKACSHTQPVSERQYADCDSVTCAKCGCCDWSPRIIR